MIFSARHENYKSKNAEYWRQHKWLYVYTVALFTRCNEIRSLNLFNQLFILPDIKVTDWYLEVDLNQSVNESISIFSA